MTDNELSEVITFLQALSWPILKEEFKMTETKQLATLRPVEITLKQAEDIARIIEMNPAILKDGLVIELKVKKSWSELDDAEKYSATLYEVRKANTIADAKNRFCEIKGVETASTFEEIAAIVWAARIAHENKRCGEVKNFPSSERERGTQCGCKTIVKGREVKIKGTILLSK